MSDRKTQLTKSLVIILELAAEEELAWVEEPQKVAMLNHCCS